MRPNIVFAFADDYGRFAGCYSKIHGTDSLSGLIDTPNIDRLAAEGALFTNALVPAPSCTPCRSSVISGKYFWQTKLGAILHGAVFDHSIQTFPVLLKDAGYDVGFSYKVWGPGVPLNDPYAGEGRRYQSAGSSFDNFSIEVTSLMRQRNQSLTIEEAKQVLYSEVRSNFLSFLDKRRSETPFFYWFGPTNTHRKWEKGSGKSLWKIDPDSLKGRMPAFYPEVPEVREDVADYLGECMAFDRSIGELIDVLDKNGELQNTMFVVSGDHGMPGFPRAKCNLYDAGSEVTLICRLPGVISAGTIKEEMVNIFDLAPTFLEAAGVEIPADMPAKSLMPLLRSNVSGFTDHSRSYVVTGRERHVSTARQWGLPYPQRAIRTHKYLYIRNFEPNRWPMGDPRGLDNPETIPPSLDELENDTMVVFDDFDASPTKAFMIHHRFDENHVENFKRGFWRRPAEELYEISSDPSQLNNLANDISYSKIKKELENRLLKELTDNGDPRVIESPCRYEFSPYTDIQTRENVEELESRAAERWAAG